MRTCEHLIKEARGLINRFFSLRGKKWRRSTEDRLSQWILFWLQLSGSSWKCEKEWIV